MYYRPHPHDPAIEPDEAITALCHWLKGRLGHTVTPLDIEKANAAAGMLLLSLGVTVRSTTVSVQPGATASNQSHGITGQGPI